MPEVLKDVIPHVGMWIEIAFSPPRPCRQHVIPHVGMWIEIPSLYRKPSPPFVIPHVGMWIEIACAIMLFPSKYSHPSRRDVD